MIHLKRFGLGIIILGGFTGLSYIAIKILEHNPFILLIPLFIALIYVMGAVFLDF
jgi:hypothetical protein